MKREWKKYKLSNLLHQDLNSSETVRLDKEYEMVGVYSYGKGLFDKEKISGINTSYKTFYKLKNGHIVFSQLFGWEGAIALCTKEFDSKYVSSQFPTFLVDENLADRNFVYYFLQLPKTWKILYETGTGMGSRRRTLTPSNFLNLEIPLPPLSEQKRIVAIIESIKNKIATIRQLRAEQEKEVRNLHFSIFENFSKNYKHVKINQFVQQVDNSEKIVPTKTYKLLGLSLAGNGLFIREEKNGSEISAKTVNPVKEFAFIYSRLFAWKGAFDLVNDKFLNCYVSDEFPQFEVNFNICNPKFFLYYFLLPKTWFEVETYCTGLTKASRNRFKEKFFLNMSIPLPPLEEQNRVVSILDKVNQIIEIHKQQEKELEELLPSLLDKAFKGEL